MEKNKLEKTSSNENLNQLNLRKLFCWAAILATLLTWCSDKNDHESDIVRIPWTTSEVVFGSHSADDSELSEFENWYENEEEEYTSSFVLSENWNNVWGNITVIYNWEIIYRWWRHAIPNYDRDPNDVDKFVLNDFESGKPIREVVVIKNLNGKETLFDSKLWKIWDNYDEIDLHSGWEDNCDRIDWEYIATEDHLVINATKKWKRVLIVDGKDYEIMKCSWKFFYEYEYDDGFMMQDIESGKLKKYHNIKTREVACGIWLPNIIFLKSWDKCYYMSSDCILHEYEWEFDDIVYVRFTSDWICYFIGKKWDKEIFVYDWRIMWKEYDHISWAWLLEWWWVYVRWERNWENILVLNGAERWEDNTESNSKEREHDLFAR